MWQSHRFIFLIFFIGMCQFASAQQNPAKKDSSNMYRDIEKYSKKKKSTNFIYGIFFKPVDIPAKQKSKLKINKNPQKPYSFFEGKIIREIYITTLDPFGYSATDTNVVVQNNLYKDGNKLHIKTQRITIRNLLLIHKNDVFDSLLVRESERLIRNQKYVHEVGFFIRSAGRKSDSVDVFIRVLDTWSIIPSGSVSTAGFRINLTDKNIMGFGHEFQNSFASNFINTKNTFNTNYFVPSITNTYISATLHYGVDGYGNFSRSLAIDRPFYSPFAKWAAGAFFSSQLRKDSLRDINAVYVPVNFKFNTQDYWAGNALQVFKGSTEADRATNLILAIRYLRIRYFEHPADLYDPAHIYSNEDFYLSGIGISTRKYVQDKYIFNYGVTEDVPVGKVYGLTGGYQVKSNNGRMYLGVRFSTGNYHDWGYISTDLEYGSFYRASRAEQSVFIAGLNYFTDLFEIGNWKFRQFVKPQLTLGINRFDYETIGINNENGIRGFNSISLQGTKKIVLTLQTQSYSPWNLLGFRFGPYFVYSVGMLGNAVTGFKRSGLYSEFSLGVLIKNEFLVINNFQFSVAYYPLIPGQGDNIIKLNSNSTSDIGFRDFIFGKPETVAYQ